MQLKSQHFFDIAALAIVLTTSGCAHHHKHGGAEHAHGHSHGHGEGEGLTVLGTGEAKASPDVAHTSIGVEVHAETAEQATAQANERMTAVLAAIKGTGVADVDLQTHDFSVSFERDYTPPPAPQPTTPPAVKPGKAAQAVAPVLASSVPRGSYRVSNNVEVTVRDLGKVSAVLSAATAAGANNVWGIHFDVENPDPLHEKAREQAISRARHNAEQLAKLTGVKLGDIITVEDQADSGQSGPRMFAATLAANGDGSQVPVQGGELTVTHQVRLVYALEK